MSKEKLLSPSEAAEFLEKSLVTLRRWDKQGILTPIREGKMAHRRYKKSDLLHFLTAHKKPKLKHKHNTFVFDFDSTLHPQETLDEVLKLKLKNDPEKASKFKLIEDTCKKGMEGEITLQESLQTRLKIAQIHKKDIEAYLKVCPKIDTEIQEIVQFLQKEKQLVLVISGGFSEWIIPLTSAINIPNSQVFTNRFIFDQNGYVSGFMTENPLCQNGGKPQLIQELKSSGIVQGDVVMVGDGASDLETLKQGTVDLFLGFGIYAQRKTVKEEAPYFFTNFKEFHSFLKPLIP